MLKKKYNSPDKDAGIGRDSKGKFKKGIVVWNKGTKGIMKAWNKGLKNCYSKEIIDKMSLTHKKMTPPFLGKYHSSKTKELLRKKNLGKSLSKLIRKKISESLIGRKVSQSTKDKLKIIQNSKEYKTLMSKYRSEQIFPIKDTSIEVKIQTFLKELDIGFFTHYYTKEITHSYQCDILIPVQKNINRFIKQPIIIECDGDWFHCNPKKYNKEHKIYRNGMTAEERWKLDNTRTQELVDKGFRVIRLWEMDINSMDLNIFKELLKGG